MALARPTDQAASLQGLVPVSPCRLLASSRSLAHRLHQLLDMKIFVDTDSDIRLVRRLRRDISERGRDIEGVIKQYNKFVKPSFDQYIQPTMRLADIVVPRGEPAGLPVGWVSGRPMAPPPVTLPHPAPGSGNTVAIDLIVQHVHSQLEEVSGPQPSRVLCPHGLAQPHYPLLHCHHPQWPAPLIPLCSLSLARYQP